MKRFLLILLAAMLVFLGGCSGDEEEGPAATPTPSPVPSPTPVARLSAAQYSYVEYRNNVIPPKVPRAIALGAAGRHQHRFVP